MLCTFELYLCAAAELGINHYYLPCPSLLSLILLFNALFSFPLLFSSQGIWSCIHGVHIDMKKKAPELDFSPQANMLHLLKSAKSVALSPKRNTVLLQPSLLDVMSGKGSATGTTNTIYFKQHLCNGSQGFCCRRAVKRSVGLHEFSDVTLPFPYRVSTSKSDSLHLVARSNGIDRHDWKHFRWHSLRAKAADNVSASLPSIQTSA